MRSLANENFPLDAVEAIRQAGHVVWIRTEAPGASDQDVLHRATSEQRVLLTFDKDFGDLAMRQGLPASSGLFFVSITSSVFCKISGTHSDSPTVPNPLDGALLGSGIGTDSYATFARCPKFLPKRSVFELTGTLALDLSKACIACPVPQLPFRHFVPQVDDTPTT
jgi:hypothetical protein